MFHFDALYPFIIIHSGDVVGRDIVDISLRDDVTLLVKIGSI